VRLVDMARLIVEIAGKGRLAFVPWDALAERIETGDFVADVSRIARELDWRPQVALEDGIARTVAAERAR
jgi:nucleoside-diphosphate-sugar epimerase